jgi:hypothetical protein
MQQTTTRPWRKSSYSGADNANCLEVRDDTPSSVPVRDSKQPEAAQLTIRADAWQAFLTHIR